MVLVESIAEAAGIVGAIVGVFVFVQKHTAKELCNINKRLDEADRKLNEMWDWLREAKNQLTANAQNHEQQDATAFREIFHSLGKLEGQRGDPLANNSREKAKRR